MNENGTLTNTELKTAVAFFMFCNSLCKMTIMG